MHSRFTRNYVAISLMHQEVHLTTIGWTRQYVHSRLEWWVDRDASYLTRSSYDSLRSAFPGHK